MIYVKPRRMMRVDRMRRQQAKHHDLRYRTIEFPRDLIEHLGLDGLEFMLNETMEYFRMEVARWNMWQKRKLGPVTTFTDYNLDFNTVRYIIEVRRLPRYKPSYISALVEKLTRSQLMTPNEIRKHFGMEPL